MKRYVDVDELKENICKRVNGMTHKPDTFCSYGEHKRRKK